MNAQKRSFGQNLSAFMYRKGISVEELADRLGYTVYEVHRILESRLFVNC